MGWLLGTNNSLAHGLPPSLQQFTYTFGHSLCGGLKKFLLTCMFLCALFVEAQNDGKFSQESVAFLLGQNSRVLDFMTA